MSRIRLACATIVTLALLAACSNAPIATEDPIAAVPEGGGVDTPTAASGALGQSQLAAEHAQLAADTALGGDLAGAQRHTEHVINIIVGSEATDTETFGLAYGDHNGDGTAENPGDGYGVWPYANDAIQEIDDTFILAEMDADTSQRFTDARQCLINLREQQRAVLEQAETILAATDANEAATIAEAMAEVASAGVTGECGAQAAYNILTELMPMISQP